MAGERSSTSTSCRWRSSSAASSSSASPWCRCCAARGDRERLRAIARRFGYGSLGALLVLVLTGWALASHFHLWASTTLHWKLALVVLVIVLALAHLRWAKVHALQAAILLASLAIVWLGIQLATGGA